MLIQLLKKRERSCLYLIMLRGSIWELMQKNLLNPVVYFSTSFLPYKKSLQTVFCLRNSMTLRGPYCLKLFCFSSAFNISLLEKIL